MMDEKNYPPPNMAEKLPKTENGRKYQSNKVIFEMGFK